MEYQSAGMLINFCGVNIRSHPSKARSRRHPYFSDWPRRYRTLCSGIVRHDTSVCDAYFLRQVYVLLDGACLTLSLPPRAPRPVVLPLHAGLTTKEQLQIFTPVESGHRKVIVSTNIAEV